MIKSSIKKNRLKKTFSQNLNKEQKLFRKRILEVSHERKFSHIGSCLSAVDIISSIYKIKNKGDKFILSSGHAGVAWYVVLEKYGLLKKSDISKLHLHPDRNTKIDIHVSTGSLGQGLPIGIGMALANRKRNVYCLISDGECTEGSIWESLRLASEQKLNNLKMIINANGYGGYDKINLNALMKKIKAFEHEVLTVDGHNLLEMVKKLNTKIKDKPLVIFAKTTVEQLPFLKGQDAHYKVMTDEDYNSAIQQLE